MKKLVSLLLALSIVFTLFATLCSVSATTVTGTVTNFSAASNNGQIHTGYEDYCYWKTVFISGTGAVGSTTNMRLVNKATGLYLCEKDGALIQTGDSSDSGTTFILQDWYGSPWTLRTATGKYLGTDNNMTVLSGSEAASSDHATDGMFNGEGWELVFFSDDGTYKNASTVVDGTEYVLYTKSRYGNWMQSCLEADAVETEEPGTDEDGNEEELPTDIVSADVGATALPDSEDAKAKYVWTAVLANGNIQSGATNSEGYYYFVNKVTGLYLTDVNGTLITQTKNADAAQVWAVKDNWGYKFIVYNTTTQNRLNTDHILTFLAPGGTAGSNQMTDGVNTANGFEMIDLISVADGTTLTSIADGAEVYIASRYDSQLATYYLYGSEPAAEEPAVQEFTLATAVSTEEEASWWKFIVATGGYKIQNVKTGLYLSNCDGIMVMSNTADTDNEVWVHQSNYGITGHIYSKADGNYITVYGGTTKLLSSASFSYEGWQSIRLIAEDGTDYHTNASTVAANEIAVKIVNRGNYDDGNPAYLTATTAVPETAAPTVKLVGATKVRLNAIEGYQYSTDGKTWQDSAVIENVTAETVIYQRNTDTPAWYSEGITVELTGLDNIADLEGADYLVHVARQIINDGDDFAADATEDGEIDIRDLVRVKKYILAGQL